MNPEYVTKAKAAAFDAATLKPDHKALALSYALCALTALTGGLAGILCGLALAGLCTHVGYLRGVPLRAPAGSDIPE